MKLDCKLNLENNIRSIDIFVSSLGTSVLTQDEEEAILSNYNEKIQYKDLKFEGYYKKESNKIVEATDSSDGDKVTLNLINKVIEINKDLKVNFTIETKSVKDNEIGTHLTTKDEVAEAKCWLFYKIVSNAIINKVKEMKRKETDFEDKEISRETEEF